jgi:hypothetical protein
MLCILALEAGLVSACPSDTKPENSMKEQDPDDSKPFGDGAKSGDDGDVSPLAIGAAESGGAPDEDLQRRH